MSKHRPGKHQPGGNKVPDTANYSGKHGKGGCGLFALILVIAVVAFPTGIVSAFLMY